jgi:hypothetical protein
MYSKSFAESKYVICLLVDDKCMILCKVYIPSFQHQLVSHQPLQQQQTDGPGWVVSNFGKVHQFEFSQNEPMAVSVVYAQHSFLENISTVEHSLTKLTGKNYGVHIASLPT